MAVCERESAGSIVISSRLINPTADMGIEETCIIDAVRVFVEIDPRLSCTRINKFRSFF